jgi:hypothetical protein
MVAAAPHRKRQPKAGLRYPGTREAGVAGPAAGVVDARQPGVGNAAGEQIAGVLRTPSQTPGALLAQSPENDPGKGGEADVRP